MAFVLLLELYHIESYTSVLHVLIPSASRQCTMLGWTAH